MPTCGDPTGSACDSGARRVLIIACAFPPTGGPGVQRSAKFAKYLPRFGWLPTVWAVERIESLPADASLAADLPEAVTVHRHRGGRNRSLARGALRWLRGGGHVGQWRHGSEPQALACANSRIPLTPTNAVRSRRLKPAARALFRRASMPDEYVVWARASVGPLCRLIREQRIDALYSTFSPASNHVLGLALKRKTGLPWVADFRDLWTDDYRYREPSVRRRTQHRRLEQAILETADVVVGVTDRQTEILADHVPRLRHRFVTITNGFDPTDFGAGQPSRDRLPFTPRSDVKGEGAVGRFVLAHVGRFDRWRTSDALFAGLKRFVAGLGDQRDRFVLHVVGHCSGVNRTRLLATGAPTTFTEYVSHGEAIRAMRRADALLLGVPSGPNADSVIPAKLFEYLAAGRPILVIGPPGGESEAIVQSCNAGLTVGFNKEVVADALAHLYGCWAAGRPLSGCRETHLAAYSRVEQTQRLAGLFDSLVVRAGSRRLKPAAQVPEVLAR